MAGDTPTTPEGAAQPEQWGSRAAFVLACIGSAVGLGNIWRFPYLAYRWGGAAWFIPYTCALLLLGIPLLSLEIGVGQVFRKAATGGYGAIAPRFRGNGVAAGTMAFIILGYYCAILSWVAVYFVESFSPNLPWSILPDPNIPPADILKAPTNHFFGDILNLTDGPLQTKYLVAKLFVAAGFQWFLNWCLLYFGIKSTGKMIYFVVLFPFAMLAVLLGRGVTLEGAGLGIKTYIGRFDGSNLTNGMMWVQAVGQCFFSLGIASGAMAAYASYNKKNENAVQNACIVGFSDMGFSFVAGFSVFGVIGYIATQMGLDDISKVPRLAGTGLAFITYPGALSTFGGVWANFFNILFFLMLFLLGTSSAISLVEGFAMNLRMTGPFQHIERSTMTTIVCVLGFLTTCLYICDSGLYWLDIIDYYTNNFNLQFIGFTSCLAAGWAHGSGRVCNMVGDAAYWLYAVGMVGGWAAFVAVSLGCGLSVGPAFGVGIACFLGISIPCCGVAIKMGASRLARDGSANPTRESAYALGIMGMEMLREKFNSVVLEDAPGNWAYPLAWSFLIKYITPGILLLMMGINVRTMITVQYEGYPWGAQMVGIGVAFCDLMLVVIGMIRPSVYAMKDEVVASIEEEGDSNEVTLGGPNVSSIAEKK